MRSKRTIQLPIAVVVKLLGLIFEIAQSKQPHAQLQRRLSIVHRQLSKTVANASGGERCFSLRGIRRILGLLATLVSIPTNVKRLHDAFVDRVS